MRKLRVGIVGCGGIANGKHLPAMKRNGNFEFVAFCDLIEERAQKAKEEYGTEDSKVYTDYNDLLKEDIEAVYVLTPNSVHAPVSIAAMEAGKNVMCEKPMAKPAGCARRRVQRAAAAKRRRLASRKKSLSVWHPPVMNTGSETIRKEAGIYIPQRVSEINGRKD